VLPLSPSLSFSTGEREFLKNYIFDARAFSFFFFSGDTPSSSLFPARVENRWFQESLPLFSLFSFAENTEHAGIKYRVNEKFLFSFSKAGFSTSSFSPNNYGTREPHASFLAFPPLV